jgi:hypothetical protein
MACSCRYLDAKHLLEALERLVAGTEGGMIGWAMAEGNEELKN